VSCNFETRLTRISQVSRGSGKPVPKLSQVIVVIEVRAFDNYYFIYFGKKVSGKKRQNVQNPSNQDFLVVHSLT